MCTPFKSWIGVLGLIVSLFACSGQQSDGPQSPVRLRLKTNGGSTYTYDGQNRLATISNTTKSFSGVFSYDDPAKAYAYYKQYANPTDRTTGTAIEFPYSFDNNDFSTKEFHIVNSDIYFPIVDKSTSYHFDVAKHMIDVTTVTGGTRFDFSEYIYTNENATEGKFRTQRTYLYRNVYEYDDKINPCFGLTDPGLDDLQRFSRNNVVKKTSIDPNGNTTSVVSYIYEYNAQNLPTKRTTTQGGSELITYTYESY